MNYGDNSKASQGPVSTSTQDSELSNKTKKEKKKKYVMYKVKGAYLLFHGSS